MGIAERLERLHKERKDRDQLPSEDEVRARLNRLKGVAHSDNRAQQADQKGHQAQFYQHPDTRTATEQVQHLVTATSAKVNLEARHVALSPEDDIAGRLAKLRGEPKPDFKASKQDLMPDPNRYLSSGGGDQKAEVGEEGVDEVARLMAKVEQEAERDAKAAIEEIARDKAIQEQLARLRVRPVDSGKVDVEEEDEDEDLEDEERLIKQLMAEARLDQDLGGGGVPTKPPGGANGGATAGEPEELPWCVICNEDALVRCLGCDGDLYCTACYKEFHVGEDPNEHRMEKFKG